MHSNKHHYCLVGRSPTFVFWQKVGYEAYTPSDSECGLLSHITHMHYQMDTNPGIGLIPNLPKVGHPTSDGQHTLLST